MIVNPYTTRLSVYKTASRPISGFAFKACDIFYFKNHSFFYHLLSQDNSTSTANSKSITISDEIIKVAICFTPILHPLNTYENQSFSKSIHLISHLKRKQHRDFFIQKFTAYRIKCLDYYATMQERIPELRWRWPFINVSRKKYRA